MYHPFSSWFHFLRRQIHGGTTEEGNCSCLLPLSPPWSYWPCKMEAFFWGGGIKHHINLQWWCEQYCRIEQNLKTNRSSLQNDETRRVINCMDRYQSETVSLKGLQLSYLYQTTCFYDLASYFVLVSSISANLLWPDDAILRYIDLGHRLDQVMAGCLTTPSHYLSQCLRYHQGCHVAFT